MSSSSPSSVTTAVPLNGYHTHVYPFMNGDVGKQYCGACPPSTPDTPTPMAVESPVEASASCSTTTTTTTSSSSSAFLETSSNGVAVSTETPSLSKASVTETIEEMAASSPNSEQERIPEDGSISVSSGQQNGEMPAEGDSQQTSTSLLPPTPSLPSPVPSCSSDATQEGVSGQPVNLEEVSEERGKSGELTTPATTSENQGTQTTPAQTPTPTPVTPAATPVAQQQQASQPLTRDQIQQMVAQQVEYVFSRENLNNDPYLISQMDSDQYVPVFILANCSQFKNITNDHSIIVEALKESPCVQLDEENNRVRPNYKRCIVILREIPETTPVEEIEAVFKSDDCPKVVSCEFVHNSSWYVTFESDEDAQKAYWFLRGTVQTFKGKPILARIKTKPVSRLGCLSVLPSYGGKSGTEGKDGSGPPSTPGSAGLPSGPGTPQQNANFSGPTGQRFMYSPPTSVSANSYTHTYTMPANMPTAFFYPNMVQWTAPSGFYDINGFLQFNGLSPQAAFKPPTSNHNVRYNQNRRNNKRDGNRFDKGDNRHNNAGSQGGSSGNNQGGHMGGHYHPNQRPYHRPQSSQSPSLPSHRSNHPLPSSNGGPPPSPPPPLPPPSHPATPVSTVTGSNNHPNHLSFAHCDLAIVSESDLYTSFSPPMGSAQVIRSDKKEVVTVCKNTTSTSASSQSVNTSASSLNPPPSSTSMLNATVSTVSTATSVTSAATTSAVAPTMTTNSTTQIPSPHQQGQGPPPPPPPTHHHVQQHQPSGQPHRSSYSNNNATSNDHYHHYHHHYPMPRDPQTARQLSRGARRRPRGRDDEAAASGSGRSMPQRGNNAQPPAADKSGNNSQESTPPPPPPPQFDLQATAFPPLPGADEQTPVAEEKRPAEPLPSPWGSDTQRFSDVMKGTAKPRPTSQSSEKDLPQESVVSAPPNTSSASSPCPTVTAAPTVVAAATQASQVSSSTATIPSPSQGTTVVVPVTSSVNVASSSSAVTTQQSSASQPSSSTNKQSDTRQIPREQRGVREDRRVGASGGHRDRRDYTRDHPREYSRDHRDMMRSGGNNIRDRDYHRAGREGSLRSGKENRPLPTRQWKEDKADAEGWITKGPREPRCHRDANRERERPESRETRTPLVNGDSSPPPSPKTPKSDAKVNSDESNAEYKLSCSQSLNNNDGEHKTSWAKMALASKEHMERLAAELKEKEEQEKKLRFHTRPQTKQPQEKVLIPRERDGKPMRRDGPPRENRLSSERGGPMPFRPRDSARPKSPK
ncbi:la-related protein Larp4B isoform X1 [Macrobrachium rosenbergii]|uniref:la-related protein Larp4B isoform X1 n=2 Tax=Macrobrachium rosenbergii TaxID=79674 RepID=UPI0034D7B6A7